jgi:hypothetical protein
MQYNRAKEFNADTYEYQDKLVIVTEQSGGTMIEATLDMDTRSTYTRQEVAASHFVWRSSPNYATFQRARLHDGQYRAAPVRCATNNNLLLSHPPLPLPLQPVDCNKRTFRFHRTQPVSPLKSKMYEEGHVRTTKVLFNTCHNDKCGEESKTRDTSEFILGNRPCARSRAQGLPACKRQHLGSSSTERKWEPS